jgi:preprotein translocase subunit SecG
MNSLFFVTLLTVHILLAVALIGVVLLQRSEGGMGGLGGGGMSGFMTTRGTANLLTRTTRWLAGAFMATSLVLAYMASRGHAPAPISQQPAAPVEAPAQAPGQAGGAPGSAAPENPTSGTGSTTNTTPSEPAVPTNQ